MRLRRGELPRDDGVEERPVEEFGKEVFHGNVEVSGADGFADGFGVEIAHEGHEAWLGSLFGHGGALDGFYGGGGGWAGRGGQRGDVVEDVDGFGDLEGGAHFAKHVVLGFAGGKYVSG